MASPSSEVAPHTLLGRAFFEEANSATPDEGDQTRTRLLDAAYEQFCRLGIAGSSMEEVARLAGTARITIYRKFDNKDALVEAVMLLEFRRYVSAFHDQIGRATTVQERVVAAFTTSLQQIGRNPLITRLMQTEPAMVPSLVGGRRTMSEVRHFVAVQIAHEQQTGEIPAAVSTDLAAEMVVRLCASILTAPSDLIDLDDTASLENLAREFVLPLVGLQSDPR